MFLDLTMYYVYFIKEKETQSPNVKIGYTNDFNKRIKNLQVGHPREIGYFGLIECKDKDEAKRIEKEIHKMYHKNRLVGEWFRWHSDFELYIHNSPSELTNKYKIVRYFS